MGRKQIYDDLKHRRSRDATRRCRDKKKSPEVRQRYPEMNIRLRDARLARTWTKRYVADAISIAVSSYWNYECRGVRPRQQTLKKLCNLFMVTAQELGYPEVVEVAFDRDRW
jgi:ribosome-binding protein aMBF1 (putative translation factor)